MAHIPLEDCIGFEWDEANVEKNWQRHRVTAAEAEDVFFGEPLVLGNDIRHSKDETRYFALGTTSAERRLFIAFAIRRGKIRVISARDMNRNETAIYTKHEKKNS